jgi:protein TonB
MATQPVEIHLQLAALARTTSAPTGYLHWARAHRRLGSEYFERLQVVSRVAATRLRSAPRPSWPALLAAAFAAALLMWWVMREHMPAIDPHAVIATHLAAADAALDADRYLEPLEHSALHHYRTVLALDPANAQARNGLAVLAERFVEDARAAIVDRRLAEAVIAIDGLRRVAPEHRRLSRLNVQLRRAIDETARMRALEALSVQAAQRTDQQVGSKAEQKIADKSQAAPASRDTRSAQTPLERPQPPSIAGDTRKPPTQVAAVAQLPLATPASSGATPNIGAGADAAGHHEGAAPLLTEAGAPIAPGADELSAQEPSEASGASAAPAPPVSRKLLRYVAPDYPREALMRGIEGWVDLDLTINAAGDVVASHVTGGKARQVFDRAAAGAVRRWKYEPRTGADPFQALQVRVTFELEK